MGAPRAASWARIWWRRPVRRSFISSKTRFSCSVPEGTRASSAYSRAASFCCFPSCVLSSKSSSQRSRCPPEKTGSCARRSQMTERSARSWRDAAMASTRKPRFQRSLRCESSTIAQYVFSTAPVAIAFDSRVAALEDVATSNAPLTGRSRRCTAAAYLVPRLRWTHATASSFTLGSPVRSSCDRTPFGLLYAITCLSSYKM
mmetsp:Transcript_25577/g.78670  ORF Transcript_25577/g.78670 Transcript_25577/m.78670 type:complete len:202 (+) Transcript_25577:318-923(+)